MGGREWIGLAGTPTSGARRARRGDRRPRRPRPPGIPRDRRRDLGAERMAGRSGLAAAAPSRGLLREALAAWSPTEWPSGAAARPAAACVPAEDARPGGPGKDRSRTRSTAGGPAVQGWPAAHRGGTEIPRRGRRRDGEGVTWTR